MNFAPFDTALIVDRLREQVGDLHHVAGAADYAAVQNLSAFRTPSAFVIFGEETNTGKVPSAPCVNVQESLTQFGVVLALRHYRERMGEQMQQDARALIGQARAALIGWRPPENGARVVGWVSGKTLDYDASVLLFADLYQLHVLLNRDEVCAS